ncbi:unnamed protein product [Chrysodeixis includens]|uniref:isopentenyl-diphosphate Delta-isomerase n=1 Tax=Chrysodeixis includens TaxID=689277 RepID=A0A9N8PZH7_CHRIL|nr:unnamed protein product [Chrysodeixis includens]
MCLCSVRKVLVCNSNLRSFLKVGRKYLSGAKMNYPSNQIHKVQNEALDNDMCLLVDETDKYLGPATKRACHRVAPDGTLLLHRAFSVLMFNAAGDILLQKRTSQKITYPNCYTNACCSHPLLINGVQEDVTTAAIRRLKVELGLSEHQLQPRDFTLLARILYKDPGDGVWGEFELDYILILQKDVDITPNPNEIAEIEYVSRNNFDNFIANLRDPVTPWFKLMCRHMLPHWWDNLHRLEEIAEPQNIRCFVNKL